MKNGMEVIQKLEDLPYDPEILCPFHLIDNTFILVHVVQMGLTFMLGVSQPHVPLTQLEGDTLKVTHEIPGFLFKNCWKREGHFPLCLLT